MKTTPPDPTISALEILDAPDIKGSTNTDGSVAVCEAPAVPKPAAPIHTSFLPVAFVALDIEVREKYLSDDLSAVCEIAGRTGSAVLISTAGFPLDKRQASFAIWRKEGLHKLVNTCPAVGDFLSSHSDLGLEFGEGTIDLLKLDRLIGEYRDEKERRRLELRRAHKDALREAMDANCEDMTPGTMPQHLVVREDGKMKLLKNPVKAKAWGQEGGKAFYLIPLEMQSLRVFIPEDE